jgi:hypothetical protein
VVATVPAPIAVVEDIGSLAEGVADVVVETNSIL